MSDVYILKRWQAYGSQTFIEGVFTDETTARKTFKKELDGADSDQVYTLLRCQTIMKKRGGGKVEYSWS